MWKTIVRRILILIPQLIILSLIIFLLADAMPGDALTGLVDPDMHYEDLLRLRAELGLDRPWPERYVEWLGNLMRGDLGRSWRYRMPVTEVIAIRAANTIRLGLLSIAFAYIIGVPLGLIAGKYREKLPDRSIIFYTFIALAMPTAVLALILLFLFVFVLPWFPFGGSVAVTAIPGTMDYVFSRMYHLILPAATGALLSTVGLINLLRSEVIECENADYVTTARSKGVPTRKVYTNHILKNACLPVVMSVGFIVPGFLTGAVFIENVFSFPGMGQLFLTSIIQRDFAIVNGLVIIFAAIAIFFILLADILMMIVDPRIRIK